jgi:hypothetical protein
VAELALLADRAFAAFRVLAVRQTICRMIKKFSCHLLQTKYSQTCVNNDQSDPQLSKTNNIVYDQPLKNNHRWTATFYKSLVYTGLTRQRLFIFDG